MAFPVSEFELIQEISGVDEFGNGKCTISIQPQRCDAEGTVVNTDDEFITEKPVVHLFKQAGGYVLVDFVFESVHDVDLQRMYAVLEDFFAATNSVSDDELDFPLFALSIVPNALEGRFFAIGFNPIFYALAPDDVCGEPKIIRMAFVCQDDPDVVPNFLFLQSDDEELEKIVADEESDNPDESVLM